MLVVTKGDYRVPTKREIEKHKVRFNKLWERFKLDERIYYLEQFVMRDKHKDIIPNVVNVTMNDPRTYADRAIAIMGTANRHLTCKGLSEHITAQIENQYDEMLYFNDYQLSLQMVEDLGFCLDWYGFIRGWLVTRTLCYKSNGLFQPEVMPLDPKYVMWDVDRKGIVWATHTYRMSREMIGDTYGVELRSTVEFANVMEFYDRHYLHLFFDDAERPALSVKHDIGECPIDVVPVPTEPQSNSEKGLERRGESGYAANRDLYENANELASLWATMSKMQVFAPVGFLSERGRKLKQRPFGFGIVVNLKAGEKFIEIPTKDMAASAQNLFGQYLARLQRGGLPFTDYGELGFELSAVAIAKLSESRDQIFVPRLKAKATIYRHIFHKIKRQTIGNGYPLSLDDEELVFQVDASLFKDDFTIQISFHAISPEQNIANLNVAQAAERYLSRYSINRDVLQLKDPAKEEAMKDMEEAEDVIQELKLFNFANRLAPVKDLSDEELNEIRAMIIYWKLMQMTGGGIQPPAELQQAQQMPNVPQIGLNISPQVAMHLTNEGNRRSGVAQLQSGQRARMAQQAQGGQT